MATVLNDDQVTQFEETGFLTVENAVDADQLSALNDTPNQWIEESRSHDGPFGKTIDMIGPGTMCS